MKIGIIGGAFDPITLSHLRIAQELIEKNMLDQVWYMPCYKSYYGKQMASGQDRLAMCQLTIDLIKNDKIRNRISVCDYEIRNQSTGCSRDIWLELMAEYNPTGHNQFYFIIGMDNALKIDSWGRSETLRELIPFLIIPRADLNEPDEAWWQTGHHLVFKDFQADFVSSSQVRQNLQIGGYSQCVAPKVLEYIQSKDLYNVTKLKSKN